MIFAGVALLHTFHWVIYIFGAVLVFRRYKNVAQPRSQNRPSGESHPAAGAACPASGSRNHGPRFFARANGAVLVTPLFIVLVFIEWTDLVFAVDSIPAVLAVTQDTFIVFTSNVMAIL